MRWADVTDKHLVFVGDGNNVAQFVGVDQCDAGDAVHAGMSRGYEMQDDWLQRIAENYPHAPIEQTTDAKAAVADADAIYTDVWTSMGQESETTVRQQAFARIPSQRRTDGGGAQARSRAALSAGRSRRGDHRRSDRQSRKAM